MYWILSDIFGFFTMINCFCFHRYLLLLLLLSELLLISIVCIPFHSFLKWLSIFIPPTSNVTLTFVRLPDIFSDLKRRKKKHKLCAQMWNLADFTLRDWLWERKCIENISQLITPLCIAQSEETRLLSFFSLILKLISPKIMVSFPLSHSFFLSHLRANVRQPINWMPFIKQSARVYKLQCSWTSTNIKKRKKTVNNTLHTHRHTINFHLFVYGESWIVE